MKHIFLPCAALAYFDEDSGISYRCRQCNAVVGSVGQPDQCQTLANKWKTLKMLTGKGWNYTIGEPE
jgi:hypothetical protein